MLNEQMLATAIATAIKTERDKVHIKEVISMSVDGAGTVTNTEEPEASLVDFSSDAIANAIGKAVAAEIIAALKNGITVQGTITDLNAIHSGTLIGTCAVGPVAVNSGMLKASFGKITIDLELLNE
jgi:hypothetical protein